MSATPQRRPTKVALSSGSGKVGTLDQSLTELLILVLDVGQGESTLVIERTGGNPTFAAVIDGGFPTAGRGVLIRYLQAFGVTKIDAMVCTHFDGDHARGLTELLALHAAPVEKGSKEKIGISPHLRIAAEPENAVRVEALYVRSVDESDFKSQTKPDLLGVAGLKGVPVFDKSQFKPIMTEGGTRVRCVGGNEGVVQDENEGSLALLIEHAGFVYYTAGDLPSPQEDALELPTVKAMKCGHHGSNGSTSTALLQKLQPDYAFISCGDQGFGHPTYGVLERLLCAESSVRHVFLTNCIHNRKGVNPDYDTAAASMKAAYEDELLGLWPEMAALPSTYDDSYVSAVQARAAAKPDTENKRKISLYLTAAEFAAQHHRSFTPADQKRATVAGSAAQPGTIVLRFTAGRCTVGCWETDAWKWFGTDSPDMAETEIGDMMKTAVAEEGEATEVVSSPVKDQKTGLSAYEQHFLDRAEHYDKRRFSRITVAGLREREGGVPFIPFCYRPGCTKDDDENDPLIHLECLYCKDEAMYFHAACYHQVVSKSSTLLFADDGCMTEVTVEAKDCPECRKVEEPLDLGKSSRFGKSAEVVCHVCGLSGGSVITEGARCMRGNRHRVPAHDRCWKNFKPKTSFACRDHRSGTS